MKEEENGKIWNKADGIQLKRLLLIVAMVTAVICLVITLFFRMSGFKNVVKDFFGIFTSFIWGAAIAFLLWPVCRFFEKYLKKLDARIGKKPHPGIIRLCSILISLVILIVLILLLLLAVLPQLINSITSLLTQLPGALINFENWINSLDNGDMSHEVVTAVQQMVNTISERLESFLKSDLLPTLETVVPNVTSSFMGIINVVGHFGLGCIISAYILGSLEKFSAQGKLVLYGIFRERTADWILREIRLAGEKFSGFVHGKLIDSLIVGVVCFIFTSLANMPYALLVSVIVGVTNVIPFFGPYLGAIPSALLILTVSPTKCVIFLVFIIILQQIDGNVLGPSILGDRLGISGIWILFSIMLFSALWGLVGMLIGVPLFAVIYDLFKRLIFRCLRLRSQQGRIEEYHREFPPEEPKRKSGRGKKKGSGKDPAKESVEG